jgi:hypothetical protein
LRHVQPGGLLSFMLLECTVALAALLALAELVSWWGVLVLPIAVAVMVKVNDMVSGAMARPVPVTQTDRRRDCARGGSRRAARSWKRSSRAPSQGRGSSRGRGVLAKAAGRRGRGGRGAAIAGSGQQSAEPVFAGGEHGMVFVVPTARERRIDPTGQLLWQESLLADPAASDPSGSAPTSSMTAPGRHIRDDEPATREDLGGSGRSGGRVNQRRFGAVQESGWGAAATGHPQLPRAT